MKTPTARAHTARLLVDVCKRVAARGFVAATDGNLSVRLSSGHILATPTMLPKSRVTTRDLVELMPDGRVVGGRRGVSSEIGMHLFIYRRRPDAGAVVHCHPVYATAFAAARLPLNARVFPEVELGLGEVPLAPYATPSTDEVAASISGLIENHDAVLLANHGVVTCGSDLESAYEAMEKVEQIAQILWLARSLGGPVELNAAERARLAALSKAHPT